MKIVFCGSSDFSLNVLKGLISSGISPELVITTPDRPQGRGYNLAPTPVKNFCSGEDIDCISPESLKEESFLVSLKKISPDLIAVASYGKIIPEEMLSIPRVVLLGIHPSLLPAFRGAAPIQRAMLEGETVTGVSLFKVIKELDAGPVLLQKTVDIYRSDDFFSLSRRLEQVSVRAFREALDIISSGNFSLSPQNEEKATYASKIEKKEGRIDWHLSSGEIVNKVRALRFWPVAYTFYKGKRVQILEAGEGEKEIKALPGEVIALGQESFSVACGKGAVNIRLVKPEGKKEMPAYSFICGYRLEKGSYFSQE